MYISDVETISQVAVKKYTTSKEKSAKFIMRAVVAGFFIVVAIMISYVTAAVLYGTYPAVARVMCAVCFSTAIILIVFVGGELFTGNNLVMAMGMYTKKITIKMTLRVWGMSYLGNLLGCIILGTLFVKSGASLEILKEYIAPIVEVKLHLSALELFLRGMICNFLVCIAVLVPYRMKSESGKLFIMFWVIFTFVIAGFEHSIANMGIFTISYLTLDGVSIGLIIRNLFFVSLGNIVGGACLLGWPLTFMSIEE